MLYGPKDDNKMANVNNIPADNLASGPMFGVGGEERQNDFQNVKTHIL
jgi:hypothetical protein